MKKRLQVPLFTFLLTLLCLGFSSDGWGQQTFYPLSSGNYSQDFSNISGWTNSYAAGVGAENWRVATSVPTSPGTNFAVFTTTTAGGVQKGTQAMVFLATGTNAGATDLLMNFTGRTAGNLSFDYEKIANSAVATPRSSDLKIQYSLDNGLTFTDFTGYTIPRILNNTTPESGIINIALPSALNNQSQVVIRFYFWNNGQTTGSGNRPKWGVDNVIITSSAVGTPLLSASVPLISGLNYIENSGPSPIQSFTFSGSNMDGSEVTVALPSVSDFEISSNQIDFFEDLSFLNYDGSSTLIYVRLKAGLAVDTYNDIITISGGGAVDDVTVEVSGEVTPVPTPTLLATPTALTNLNYMFGNGPSAAQTFELIGVALDGSDVNISVPNQFEISTDNVSFSGAVLLSAYDGSNTTIYVRLAAGLSENTYTADADITGGSASPIAVSLQGNVTPFVDQYDGIGLFKKISSVAELTDGYYVILNETSQFIMTSNRSGTLEAGYYISDDAIVSNGTVVNPSTANVWQIEANSSGRTIYNEVIQKYVGWISGNSASAEDIVADRTRWTFTYTDDKFNVNNVETPIRQLSYNSGSPRFAAYGNDGQQELQLYKFINADYTYQDGVWTPESPVGESTETDDILIINGTVMFDQSIEMNNLYILSGASLEVEDVLTINGNIDNDGAMVFKSTSIANTAQLDTFTGSITGSGEVTIERFIPARRAFRFLSSAVSTSGSIRANWQEGQNNTGVVFPGDNQNAVPGFGTHITGSTTGANGFDATVSGNPSLFTLNNTTQLWEAVANTDVNTIAAGTPYRMLVRGDRSVNVTLNSAAPTNTILRTTGTLHTGPFTTTGFSQVADDSNFFGNPYPAAVDMIEVIGVSTNINPNFYYVWDPTLSGENGRGAYVMVDFIDGTTPSGSEANQFLQPGQAGFVRTQEAGMASLNFQEAHKNVAPSLTSVFNVSSKIDLRLFRAEAYTTGNTASDGLRFRFGDDYTNALTAMDALKLFNQDENLASSNDERLWNMESRYLPQVGEVLPLFTNQYRTTDYVFEAELNNITGVTAYLRDTFTGEDLVLNNDDATIYAFTIDAGNPDSSASDRFEIVFEQEVLGTNENVFGNGFVLYPNPVQNDNFFIATRGLQGQNVTVEIYSMLGQLLVSETPQVAANGRVAVAVPQLPSGVFTVTLTAKDGSRFTTKLINQ